MTRFESLLLQVSTVASALSGIVFLAMKHLMENDDPFSVVGHPWQPHMLAAHVLVGPVVVFALGLISREHIFGRFLNGARKEGRRSGASTILLGAPMILSGYFLQVATGETIRLALVIVHVGTGLLFVTLFFWHLRAAAARRRGERPGARYDRPPAGALIGPARRVRINRPEAIEGTRTRTPGGNS